nr:hypothetical protein [Tanacetum cinerariifolium]
MTENKRSGKVVMSFSTDERDMRTPRALELMLPWILKKNTKCLMLLVKNLVLPSKSWCCWISAEGRINAAGPS